jgi:hypothetical protein
MRIFAWNAKGQPSEGNDMGHTNFTEILHIQS